MNYPQSTTNPIPSSSSSSIPSSSTSSNNFLSPTFTTRIHQSLRRQFQRYLDESVPHIIARWSALVTLFLLYGIRVYLLQGFYIITYGLGIFLLNLLIGFLSPIDENAFDSGSSSGSNGAILPTSGTGGDNDEFKPFIRRLPEFKFWYACSKAILVAIFMTFFNIFDIPVFWPILLVYFIVLFVLTMKRQIKHMIKHRYIPFNIGKKTYKGKQQRVSKIASDVRTR